MATGRIETYVHSDSTTQNKGAAMIRVTSETDFGARTDMFVNFAREAAKYVFASLGHTRAFIAGPSMWTAVVVQYPHLEEQRMAVSRELKESVTVAEIAILRL